MDAETGNYYYGARYYDPKVSVWLSVDPLAGKFPSLSPYAFVANNPISLVDPDGRDIWEIDGKGNIVSHTVDKTQDAFYRVDNDGNRIEGESISFEYGTITAQRNPTITVKQKDGSTESRQLTLFEVKGDDNGQNLFEFFASNEEVEYTHAKVGSEGSGRNIVGTSHDKSSTPVGHYLRSTGYSLREVNHNHPSGNYLPSGSVAGKSGDKYGATLYKASNPNVKLHIYTVGRGYSEYDEKGSLDFRDALPPVNVKPKK